MTTVAIKHYNLTLANQSHERQRRLTEYKKQFRTYVSRRRAKQALNLLLTKMHF